MAVVTQRFSTYVFGERRSVIEFDVTDVANAAAAAAAVPYQKNSTHPSNSAQVMEYGPEVQRSIEPYLVRCEFTVPETGTGSNGGGTTDPLLLPTEIEWGRSTISEPTDIDVNNHRIANTAGDKFNPRPVRTFTARTFTIFKTFKFYNYALADAFEERVNSAPWRVANSAISFPKGTVKCLGIIPTSRYDVASTVVRVAFTFEVRTTLTKLGAYPFQTILVNQGRTGWYSDTTATPAVPRRGAITKKGVSGFEPVTEDVLLNVNGTPFDTSLTVEGRTPVANPSAISGYHQISTSDPAVIMVWDTTDEADFNQLPL